MRIVGGPFDGAEGTHIPGFDDMHTPCCVDGKWHMAYHIVTLDPENEEEYVFLFVELQDYPGDFECES